MPAPKATFGGSSTSQGPPGVVLLHGRCRWPLEVGVVLHNAAERSLAREVI